MEAPSVVCRTAQTGVDECAARQVVRAVLATAFASVALAALVLCARRIRGELGEPLPAVTLAVLAVGLAAAAVAFRRFAASYAGDDNRFRHVVWWAAPTLVVALWAVGLLSIETSAAGWAVFLGVLLTEEGWSWGRLKKGSGVILKDSRPLFDAEQAGSAEVDESATQWLVRRREPEGGEMIDGWIRVPINTGQRHASAHLAICPALADTPVCYAEASDGPDCQVKVGQALPYGVRFDLKLDEAASEPCEVLLEFSIQQHGPS